MAPATQTRVVVTAFNPADPTSTLAVEEAPLPALKAGDVLVRVTARPVNPADVFSIMVRAAAAWRGRLRGVQACAAAPLVALASHLGVGARTRDSTAQLLRAVRARAAVAAARLRVGPRVTLRDACACGSQQGVYPGFTPAALPAVPGLEGAGVIEDANGSAHAVGTRGTVFFNAKEVRQPTPPRLRCWSVV
jgi:hypothetical protein